MMDLRAGLARWLPRLVLALVFFFIAVDIAPEVDASQPDGFARQDVFRRFLSKVPSNRSFLAEKTIDGSNWWESCGPHMHRCRGQWLPEEKEYCCCDQGYAWDSDGATCKIQMIIRDIRAPSEPLVRGHLLFCSALDGETADVDQDMQMITTYNELGMFDETSLLRWASQILKEDAQSVQEVDGALTALESHHVDGAALLKLTRSKLDAEWNLMNIGIPQAAAEVLVREMEILKPSSRRLSTGTSGCDDDKGSGTSGCDTPDEPPRHLDRSHSQALQGCSKSSSGTRGCESHGESRLSGAKGCESSSLGAKGCHSHSAKGCHAHAARGCDSGVQGCHSGVCGCEEKSNLGDLWGLLLFFPFIMIIAMQAVLAPAILVAALLLPALLLIGAFVTGSFLVLLWAACSAALWASVAWFYQRRPEEASRLLEHFGLE